MRKIDVVRPPINYVVANKKRSDFQVAWFISEEDATDFVELLEIGDTYGVYEVRR